MDKATKIVSSYFVKKFMFWYKLPSPFVHSPIPILEIYANYIELLFHIKIPQLFEDS